jgi:hypothetical protein
MGNCGSSLDCTRCYISEYDYGDERKGCKPELKVNADIAGIGVGSSTLFEYRADAKTDPHIILLQRLGRVRRRPVGILVWIFALEFTPIDRPRCNEPSQRILRTRRSPSKPESSVTGIVVNATTTQ